MVDQRQQVAAGPCVLGLEKCDGDALADRLRLADVDDAAACVAEQVDAGLVGQRAALLAQALGAGLGTRRPGGVGGIGHPGFEDRVSAQPGASHSYDGHVDCVDG